MGNGLAVDIFIALLGDEFPAKILQFAECAGEQATFGRFFWFFLIEFFLTTEAFCLFLAAEALLLKALFLCWSHHHAGVTRVALLSWCVHRRSTGAPVGVEEVGIRIDG